MTCRKGRSRKRLVIIPSDPDNSFFGICNIGKFQQESGNLPSDKSQKPAKLTNVQALELAQLIIICYKQWKQR